MKEFPLNEKKKKKKSKNKKKSKEKKRAALVLRADTFPGTVNGRPGDGTGKKLLYIDLSDLLPPRRFVTHRIGIRATDVVERKRNRREHLAINTCFCFVQDSSC